MALMRLYEELNDYLPADERKQDICIPIPGSCSVRSILLDLNVPMEEVDLILVNSQPADADCVIQADDRVSVYPVFERFNIETVTRVRSRPLRRPRFITDAGLEELAHLLRAQGLDVVCHDSAALRDIILQAEKDRRIILTLDGKRINWQAVTRAIFLKTRTTESQIQEIVQYLDL